MMKYLLYTVLAVLTVGMVHAEESPTAAAYTWIAGPNKDVRVSVYYVARNGDYARYFTEIADSTGSRVYADQLDCVEKTARTTPVMHVSPTGEVVYKMELDEVRRKLKEAEWEHIVADTLGEQIYDTLCKDPEEAK